MVALVEKFTRETYTPKTAKPQTIDHRPQTVDPAAYIRPAFGEPSYWG